MTRSEVRVPHRPPYLQGEPHGCKSLWCAVTDDALLASTKAATGSFGDVAQLVRAPALQAGGPGFESPLLHQNNSTVELLKFLHHFRLYNLCFYWYDGIAFEFRLKPRGWV